MTLLLLLACTGDGDVEAPGDSAGETDADTDSDTDTDTDTDTDADTDTAVAFDETFDVVVVGAGPAGTAAAISAREEGATVLLLDREEEPGFGLVTGGQAFAVGTPWQAGAGIVDSVEIAQADWAEITAADPSAAGVVDFLTHSAETLEWLTTLGARVEGVYQDSDCGSLPRIHPLDWVAVGDGRGMHLSFDGELRAGVEVTAPVLRDGAVIGVEWRDVVTGETGRTGAGAVVIATGGFVRDREEVDRVAPELAGRSLVVEANYHSDGGGLPFLDAVGAARLKPEQIGIYVHSIQDPELESGESVLAIGSEAGILVDSVGARFANEEEQKSFDLFDLLPEGDVYAVLAGDLVRGVSFMRPAYNWSVFGQPDFLALDDLLRTSEDLFYGATLEEAAVAAGLDPALLAATVEDWNLAIATGNDLFGRSTVGAYALEGDEWLVVRLTPGLAKNFGGVSTDADGHVLDTSDVPIPGLFAAGEVAGMVLGGGGGDGFSGSVNACFWGGRVAGRNASAFAGGAE